MPSKLTWTIQARRDILDIYELIGLEQPAAAERYFDRIEALGSLLRDQPRLGVARPDIASGLRMLIDHPCVLLYRIALDQPQGAVLSVEIVCIVDGRQNLKGLFQEADPILRYMLCIYFMYRHTVVNLKRTAPPEGGAWC